MAHQTYTFEDVLDVDIHPSLGFTSLAEIKRPIQTTRGGLYAVWFPTGIICAGLLPELEVKEREGKMNTYMEAHAWEICDDVG